MSFSTSGKLEWLAQRRQNAKRGQPPAPSSRLPRLPLGIRLTASVLSLLLFLTSSPPLLAITMGQIKAGVAGSGGGQGSYSNLQTAGAASAALTAAMTKKSQEQAAAVIAAMKKLQSQAASAAKANPATVLLNGQTVSGDGTVYNGLKNGWLEPYVSGGGPGIVNGTPVTTSWSGAGIDMTKTTSVGAAGDHHVEIKQTSQNAYLYWNKFNVGPKTTVNFDQSAGGQNVGTWIAFNKVMSASDPSHIFGNITAQGQVYVLNQNGILFHNGSTVNTRSFVASTLPINPNLSGVPDGNATVPVTASGLANNPDYQFLFSALPVSAGTVGPTAAWSPTVSGAVGDVVVEQGASITASSANNSGGLIALVGPKVLNQGTLSAPNGQVSLVAGLQVGMTPHANSDPSLRGLDFYVGKVADPSIVTVSAETGVSTTGFTGSAENDGLISVHEGDATMIGKTIVMNGAIDSTTSVSFNGRVDLMAVYDTTINDNYLSAGQPLLYQSTGSITIGANPVAGGAVIEILPEWDSTATITGTTLALNSLISIQGLTVYQGHGSILYAPGAVANNSSTTETGLTLSSGVTIAVGNWFDDGSHFLKFIRDAGQIYIDSDAVIDVSGSTDVPVDSAQNFITIQLRAAQLAGEFLQYQEGDTAYNQANPIYGKNLTVDVRNSGNYNGTFWIGTPLGDATGYAALIERGVGQLTINGGSVSLLAGDSVVTQPGSLINVSGGYVRYSGGSYSTTSLINSLGQVIPISQATPDQIYTAIVKNAPAVYEAPYLSGGNGGSLLIQGASVALDGSMKGITSAGEYQLRPRPVGSVSQLPTLSSLSLMLSEQFVLNNVPTSYSPYAPMITFSSAQEVTPVQPFFIDGSGNPDPLPVSRSSQIFLNPSLFSKDGFGTISISNHDGGVVIPNSTSLNLGAMGSLNINAATIQVDGSINSPDGNITLTADRVPYSLQNALGLIVQPNKSFLDVLVDSKGKLGVQYGAPDANGNVQLIYADGVISARLPEQDLSPASLGKITISSSASINVSGSIVDDSFLSGIPRQIPDIISGGSISINAYDTVLARGSVLDVSGGAYVSPKVSITYGNAGAISLSGGQDPEYGTIHSGSLSLQGAQLRGDSGLSVVGSQGGKPGTLSIAAPSVTIGDTDSPDGGLQLSPSFFDTGGFGTFNISGVGRGLLPTDVGYQPGISISPNVIINPSIRSYSLSSSLGGWSEEFYHNDNGIGYAPSLSLSAIGLSDGGLPPGQQLIVRGDFVQGNGSRIQLDPKLILSTGIPSASTGSLKITGQTVEELGNLDVPGGAISLTAGNGLVQNYTGSPPAKAYVTLIIGSQSSLSTTGEELLMPDPSGIRHRFGTVLNGGSIALNGNIAASAGAILQASGSTGVFDDPNSGVHATYRIDSSGGAISMKGGQMLFSDATLQALSGGISATGGTLSLSSGGVNLQNIDFNLLIDQAGKVLPVGESVAIGNTLISTDPILAQEGGHISVSSFENGGFDSLNFGGNVFFHNALTISVPGSIFLSSGGILGADSTVSLSASAVTIGQAFAAPLAVGNPLLTSVFGDSVNKIPVSPTYGAAQLDITGATLINVGNVCLKNIGSVNLSTSPGGAIRGDGTFVMAGNLLMDSAQIYPVSGVDFTVIAFSSSKSGNLIPGGHTLPSGGHAGSITIRQSGSAELPFSAGGNLSLFADTIIQSGTLLAPFGSITLGANLGSENSPDPITLLAHPDNSSLRIATGSVTSVSGLSLTLPYGSSTSGSDWIDPTGTDITTTGLPQKTISTASAKIDVEASSSFDLSGGGELLALRWVSGLGGTVNDLGSSGGNWAPLTSYHAGDLVTYGGSTWSARADNVGDIPSVGAYWTKLPQMYAIVPTYQMSFSPTGYSDGSISLGSSILLNGGGGLPSGNYTLLPPSYANLAGAYLISETVTSRDTRLPISQINTDGSALLSGTIYNTLNSGLNVVPNASLFTLYSPEQVAHKVQYINLQADQFFSSAGSYSPKDAGSLLVSSSGGLSLLGNISGSGALAGKNSLITISAPGSFSIGGNDANINLDPTILNKWSYSSLVIGGQLQQSDADGITAINVCADSITVEPQVTLSGGDIVLVAKNIVELKDGVSITATGNTPVPDEQCVISGTDAFVRVSSDGNAALSRSGVNTSGGEFLIDGSVSLSGQSIVLDSCSNGSMINNTAQLKASAISIGSDEVDLLLSPSDNVSGNLVIDPNKMFSSASRVSLTGYSSLDFYGSGSFGSSELKELAFHTPEIRGFALGVGTAAFSAQSIALDNSPGGTSSGPVSAAPDGYLELDASTITLGQHALAIDQFAYVSLNATGVVAGTSSGSLSVGTASAPSTLFITTPLITATAGNSLTASATGDVVLQSPDPGYATAPTIQAGAGVSLSFTGSSVSLSTAISAPSGQITLHALSGDVNVGGNGVAELDVSGLSKTIQSQIVTADAGTISLQADAGNVNLGAGASLNLSASGSSSAGTLAVSAPAGYFSLDPNAVLNAAGGGSGGANGKFSLDVSSLDPTGLGPSNLSSIIPQLSPDQNGNGGFTTSLTFRIRSGDVTVDTYIRSQSFDLSADSGNIDVTPNGVIDASGPTGGSISLQASGSVILEPNSLLTVHGDTYDNAGKGGSIFLSAGAETGGQINPNAILDLQTGSALDLGVTAAPTSTQDLGGVLHLRAPITQDGSDIQIAHTDSTIDPSSYTYTTTAGDSLASAAGALGISVDQLVSANNLTSSSVLTAGTVLKSVGSDVSSIEVEGYQLYEVSGSTADMANSTPVNVQGNAYSGSQSVQQLALANAQSFFGVSGRDSATASAIRSRLEANQPSAINSILNLAPGVEIINQSGDLTLGQDWDFSTWRFGANSAPGFLTLRASGNITLNASLSDGFTSSAYTANLLPQNTALPVNFQSWSYQITAGADMTACSPRIVMTINNSGGSFGLGKVSHQPLIALGGSDAVTQDVYGGQYYQIVRTGSGDININVSGNVILWNQLASIYTAGTAVVDPTLDNTFDVPKAVFDGQEKTALGAIQQSTSYLAQFSYQGGNIRIQAAGDISHRTADTTGKIIADSTRELPVNWLYRRGAIDQQTGTYLTMGTSAGDQASTAWWVDFSNFTEGVGALGGGNIVMTAGGNISNIDAVIPTNLRMPGKDKQGDLLVAGAISPVELGGGNLTLTSQRNVDAGVYYVERGEGLIRAGGSIITNPTRDPQLPTSIDPNSPRSDPASYLPTTLFAGDSSFRINANGNILLGPIANPFLLPQGINNSFWYLNYFSTYSSDASVAMTSLGGSITLRTEAATPATSSPSSLLVNWLSSDVASDNSVISYYQPWLRLALDKSSEIPLVSLLPPTLSMTAMTGDVSLQGSFTLSPSATGEVSILSLGSINGLSFAGIANKINIWASSTINLSDANPSSIPSIYSPLSLVAGLSVDQRSSASANAPSSFSLPSNISSLFSETGSYSHDSLSAKLLLHGSSTLNGVTQPLHDNDSTPLILASQSGDISGLTLYSPKYTRILAGEDITDVGLYIQNVSATDISVVSAGGNITLYDPSSPLQTKAQASVLGTSTIPLQSGDIQISGPGTLEVLAGGTIDLGNNPGVSDPTLNVGITSIGNQRNPALPFQGADLVISAGVSLGEGLSGSASVALDSFAQSVLGSSQGQHYLDDLRDQMDPVGNSSAYTTDPTLTASYTPLDFEEGSVTFDNNPGGKALLELQLFYIVLRDTGRQHNDPKAPNYGSYAVAEKAITKLLNNGAGNGNILTWSQDIATVNGGNIDLFVPYGGVSMGAINYKSSAPSVAPGIVTEGGGSINVYTKGDVSIGINRIFTLKGGDIMMWSNLGNIAAGASSKTVQSAPPTQVLVDPTSALVETDLAGLATGGGIGTLQTISGIAPSSVDLIAVTGVIDAGDAGIRSSGNLNLAATKILNADNIAVAGSVTGAPASAPAAAAPAAPPAAAAPAAASTAAAANNSAADSAAKSGAGSQDGDQAPSIYSIDILGYGGGDDDDQNKNAADATIAPVQASL